MSNNVFKIIIPPGVTSAQFRKAAAGMIVYEPLLRTQYRLEDGNWVKEEVKPTGDLKNIYFERAGGDSTEETEKLRGLNIPAYPAPLCRFLAGEEYALFAAHPALPAQEAALMAEALELTLERLGVPAQPAYPPSKTQIAFWSGFALRQNSSNVPICLRIRTALTPERVKSAICRLSVNHEILRTYYTGAREMPECHITTENLCETEFLDFSGLEEPARSASAEQKISEAACRCLDLTRTPWRCLAIKCGASEWSILLVFSHICTDGWSRVRMRTEFLRFAGLSAESPVPDPGLSRSGSFKEYSVTLYERERQYSYNRRLVDLYRSYPLQLHPLKHIGSNKKTIHHFIFEIPEGLRRRYLEKCRELLMTPFAVTAAAFLLTLLQWREQNSTVIRISFLNRNDARSFNTIGCLTNTLYLDFSINNGPDPAACVRQVSDRLIALLDAQDIDLADLLKLAEKNGRLKEFKNAMSVSFDFYENSGVQAAIAPAVEEVYIPSGRHYPLRMTISDNGDGKSLAAVSYTFSMIPDGRIGDLKDMFLANLERICVKSV